MRFVIDNMLYDTETATLVHETGFTHRETGWGFDRSEMVPGYYRQSLWETPNGNYFYLYEYPRSPPNAKHFSDPHDLYRSMAAGYGPERKETDEIDGVIKWLESHDGAEVILNRWPGRLVAG